MKKWQILKVAALVVAGSAFAQAPPTPAQPAASQGPSARRAAVRHQLLKELNLTNAQKQEVKSIFQQAKQSAQPLRQQLKQNREALAAAAKANDTAQIPQLSQAESNLMGQLIAIRSEAKAKFYNSLTPEQKEKADQVQQMIRQRIGQHRGNG